MPIALDGIQTCICVCVCVCVCVCTSVHVRAPVCAREPAVMGWLRCRVSFSLLRSAVMCLRGSRQHVRGDVGCPALAIAEGHS